MNRDGGDTKVQTKEVTITCTWSWICGNEM